MSKSVFGVPFVLDEMYSIIFGYSRVESLNICVWSVWESERCGRIWQVRVRILNKFVNMRLFGGRVGAE